MIESMANHQLDKNKNTKPYLTKARQLLPLPVPPPFPPLLANQAAVWLPAYTSP